MKTTFCDLPLEAAPGRVFTPRPATEQLVEAALEPRPASTSCTEICSNRCPSPST